jgi:hypothetical protein
VPPRQTIPCLKRSLLCSAHWFRLAFQRTPCVFTEVGSRRQSLHAHPPQLPCTLGGFLRRTATHIAPRPPCAGVSVSASRARRSARSRRTRRSDGIHLERMRFMERADQLPQIFKRSAGPERPVGRGHLERPRLRPSCDKREMSAAALSTTISTAMPLTISTDQP